MLWAPALRPSSLGVVTRLKYVTVLAVAGDGGCNGVVCVVLLCVALIDNVRVVNGSGSYEGRLEVYYNGEWGTVCDDHFDLTNADVACRQLGYRGATRFHGEAFFGEGSGKIWLDDVNCTGTETSLHNCSHNGIGVNNCGHDADVGVVCQGMIY